MACVDTDPTTESIYVPLQSYPRCEFFQKRIKCFLQRSKSFIRKEDETVSRGSALQTNHHLLSCNTFQIRKYGNLKSTMGSPDYCAKRHQFDPMGERSFQEIHVLTSAVSYENLIQELERELNSVKEIDAALVIVDMKSKPNISETERLIARDKVMEVIHGKSTNSVCESQISVFCNCQSEICESSQDIVVHSNSKEVGEQERLEGNISDQDKSIHKSLITEIPSTRVAPSDGVKENPELEDFQEPIPTEGRKEICPQKQHRLKDFNQFSSSKTHQAEPEKLCNSSSRHSGVTLMSPPSSPRKHSRPVSTESLASTSAPKSKTRRVLFESDSETESEISVDETCYESDTSISDKQEHRYHTLGEHHHHHHQQQQHHHQHHHHHHQLQQQEIQQPQGSAADIPSNIQLSEHNLGQAISYCIESKLFDFLSGIEDELEGVKEKMGASKDITDVDKLLFEVQGIYKQGISKLCHEKNKKNRKPRIPKELMDKILDLPDVVGFGRIYGKLSVHVQPEDVDNFDYGQLRKDAVRCLTEHQIGEEELVIQLMVKKRVLTCITYSLY